MTIKHEEHDTKGRFFIANEEGNKTLAEMTYSKAGTARIIIDHTEVSDELRGQKAGYHLVEKAVEHAREKGLKIMPLCPFATSVFRKNEAFRDVL